MVRIYVALENLQIPEAWRIPVFEASGARRSKEDLAKHLLGSLDNEV